ncbi:3-oxoacyl-[acyl-carrier-protein] reductase FabG [Clostridium homopropionicum DSM 5847]|uniref:3-oxoacyl-[acyl-carrier-protein] reductase FabG n=1 Tax=Clostridium homopropionicum DSM 5847 TaxID=1121318 RepID=A0A0L6Z653_9CLOT|nr:3-oxoacyl-ACP reductase FabG [Clostridium homopropionicum]KOA18278.1 3-oxoacyl-[acyl-carrier-protein] reductase FabG [Clostridium homopropionicum DSM 5847]SFF69947.1 3-oxoacyl-[acyl-carrier-protein] reductase [Clostridium homopropionicum]
MRLKDKVSIITGGAKGIGQATSFKFAKEGSKVVVVDIDEAAINETVEKIIANGGEALGFIVDITNIESVEEMVNKVIKTYGKIDTLVNNAGIISDAQLTKMTNEQFDRVIKVNLYGTYNCAKAVVDKMKEQKSGVILNASSIVGIYGNFGQTNYAATKFGVIGMTKTWAKELGRSGIRSNVVCPGFVATSILDPMPEKVIKAMEDKVPLKRLGKPEELANVYAFLASDEASYINGAVIEVSGGVVI